MFFTNKENETNSEETTITEVSKSDEEVSEELTNDEIEQAKNVYQNYIESLNLYENDSPMPYIFEDLGLCSSEHIETLISEANVSDTETYIKSDIEYDEFKSEMLKYFSKEYFEQNYSGYKNMDGYVGFCDIRIGGLPIYEIEEFNFISEQDKQYIFEVIIEEDLSAYEYDEEYPTYEYKIGFVKENGNMVMNSKELVTLTE